MYFATSPDMVANFGQGGVPRAFPLPPPSLSQLPFFPLPGRAPLIDGGSPLQPAELAVGPPLRISPGSSPRLRHRLPPLHFVSGGASGVRYSGHYFTLVQNFANCGKIFTNLEKL